MANGQTANGLDGKDTITGGDGQDALNGGLVNDTLVRGAGNDLLIGATSNTAGELRYDAGSGKLTGDVNGDGVADFEIVFANHAALTATDFNL